MYITILKKKYLLQTTISYLGILPFIFILLDLHIFSYFSIHFLKDFIIFYTLMIFSFIGAMRWNFNNESKIIKIIYGFIPSLLSTLLIFFNLVNINKNLILFCLVVLIVFQLIGDLIFYKIDSGEKFIFHNIRMPITFIISILILYLISV